MSDMKTDIEMYIDQLPIDRREVFIQLLATIRKSIDPRFNEQMTYGMPGWVISKEVYPAGYHVDSRLPVPFLALANQKHHIALYHLGIYADDDLLKWFQTEYAATGLKLDMGKSCIRFKKMDQIPLPLIAALVERMSFDDYLAIYTDGIQ